MVSSEEVFFALQGSIRPVQNVKTPFVRGFPSSGILKELLAFAGSNL